MASSTPRTRIRNLIPNLPLGKYTPGPKNSLTDVPGVLVHTQSIRPTPSVNTGVTTILPRADWTSFSSFAGIFSFNGCGELTGAHWINETGLLTSPVVLTTTGAVGDAYRGILEYCYQYCTDEEGEMDLFIFPCVAETFDGFLNDNSTFAVKSADVINGIRNATADAVPEGNTGGGTGMICHRFKGGTGSSSRLVEGFDSQGNPKTYTVGVLAQANYGSPENLTIGGIPVGRIMKDQQAATPVDDTDKARKDGSIIIVIATDIPLLPIQLQRLAKRATIGLGRVGGYGANSSGDIFLAFSTANKIPFQELSMSGKERAATPYTPAPMGVEMCDNATIVGAFEAVAEATEEAILNCLTMAETMVGYKGRKVEALDLDKVKEIVNKRL